MEIYQLIIASILFWQLLILIVFMGTHENEEKTIKFSMFFWYSILWAFCTTTQAIYKAVIGRYHCYFLYQKITMPNGEVEYKFLDKAYMTPKTALSFYVLPQKPDEEVVPTQNFYMIRKGQVRSSFGKENKKYIVRAKNLTLRKGTPALSYEFLWNFLNHNH